MQVKLTGTPWEEFARSVSPTLKPSGSPALLHQADPSSLLCAQCIDTFLLRHTRISLRSSAAPLAAKRMGQRPQGSNNLAKATLNEREHRTMSLRGSVPWGAQMGPLGLGRARTSVVEQRSHRKGINTATKGSNATERRLGGRRIKR